MLAWLCSHLAIVKINFGHFDISNTHGPKTDPKSKQEIEPKIEKNYEVTYWTV